MNTVDSFSIYLKIIERTLEKSKGLQSPEMLEQIRQRWLSKLNDLYLGITGSGNVGDGCNQFAVKQEIDWIPITDRIFSPVLDGVKPSKLEDNTSENGASNNETDKQDSLAPIVSSKEMRNLNELETEYEYCQREIKRKRQDTDLLQNLHHNTEIVSSSAFEESNNEKRSFDLDKGNTEKDDNDDDDDFGDVSWDIVAQNHKNNAEDKQNENENDKDDESETLSDKGSDLDDVSDLEDEEPECSDVIIGHFERVIRNYCRKKDQKSKWRIRLRNGIAQIANQEIPFDTLVGEFEF